MKRRNKKISDEQKQRFWIFNNEEMLIVNTYDR